MPSLSITAFAEHKQLQEEQAEALHEFHAVGKKFTVLLLRNSVVIEVAMGRGRLAFRTLHAAGADLRLKNKMIAGNRVELRFSSVAGRYETEILFPLQERDCLRYKTFFTPAAELMLPFTPRDIFFPVQEGSPENTRGKIHFSQEGTRSAITFFSFTEPRAGTVLYLQNLSSLNDYFSATKTSGNCVVGGEWPEIGFALPAGKEPLKARKRIVLSDALVRLSEDIPKKENDLITFFIDNLADIYLAMEKPATKLNDWPKILNLGLKDLLECPACQSHNAGHTYFNAYLSDYDTPPEIMVQLAVLLPIRDYIEWSGESMPIEKKILEGLPAFYDETLRVTRRWLPAAAGKLKGDEEQKKPDVMDAWYLHHPMLNLGRMALKGNKTCEKLFRDSIGFVVKVARHFKYEWPVFYDMKTLEVIKAEREPGKGAEQDVAGLYAHVMLLAYDIIGERKYLLEAERAAKTLAGKGFELMYQANNTAFAAGALVSLYKLTGKKIFHDLSRLCLANLFKNIQLWECNYGHGKSFPNFFTIFPLSNAPYSAAYEEQEVFCAFHDYFVQTGENIDPSVNLLLSEFCKRVLNRAAYYYPPMLPKDALAEKVKSGEADHKLWIVVEDLQDGWEKSCQVGQEVYGAGNAFGILPRHYYKVAGEDFLFFSEYPLKRFSQRGKKIRAHIFGDPRLSCRVLLVKQNDPLPEKITGRLGGSKSKLEFEINDDGNVQFNLHGDALLEIEWK